MALVGQAILHQRRHRKAVMAGRDIQTAYHTDLAEAVAAQVLLHHLVVAAQARAAMPEMVLHQPFLAHRSLMPVAAVVAVIRLCRDMLEEQAVQAAVLTAQIQVTRLLEPQIPAVAAAVQEAQLEMAVRAAPALLF
jgi:hypothetical protein